MQGFWRRIGWLPIVSLLVIVFGIGIAPLLLVLALDGAVAVLIIRTACAARRPATPGRPTLAMRLGIEEAIPGRPAAGARPIPFHPV